VLWRNRDMLGRPRYGVFGIIGLPFQWGLLLAPPIGLALLLRLGLGTALVMSPLWGAAVIALFAAVVVASRGVRDYLHMNALMLSAIASLLTGHTLTDRWPRDRDASEAA